VTQKRDIEFLFELGTLRFVERKWSQFLNAGVANVAEHTLRVAWLSFLIAKYESGADLGRIFKLALIHDMTESRTGDTNPVTRQYNIQDDKKAVKDIFTDTFLQEEAESLFKEYKERKSIEAKIVKDADNLDVDLEIIERDAMGIKHPKVWYKYRDVAGANLYTKTARQLYKKIKTSDPHDWHINAPNRFEDVKKWMK